ncbi:MAG: T9SS type A sorting domain-containing protein [Flavobacteriales bacterium]|nr:T9SS type A sorting domain-containing protein [Flavobacteriales bacterium]
MGTSAALGRKFLLLAFLIGSIEGRTQCGNDNTLYNVAATPGCPGSTTVGCVWGGEYVLVNVVAGNTYTFSTCGATWDTQITLFNNTGGASLGYNDDGCGLQSTITWTATFTGQLRVLVDQWTLFVPCASNTTCAGLTISCTPGTPPTGDCVYVLNLYDSWGDGWGSSNVGISTDGGVTFTYYSVTGSTFSVPIGVNIGQTVVLSYNNSGTFQGENSYNLTLGGSALFSAGPNPTGGFVYGAVVTCQPPPSPPEDCIGAITICNDQSFNNNTSNTGNIADLSAANYGCLMSAERQGTWYIFSPATSGSIGFAIDPVGPDDYDFAIWGPYPNGTVPSTICPPSAAPIRCSFASGPSTFAATGDYDTGLSAVYANPTPADSEDPTGDGWVQGINVIADQVYLMYISNFDESGLEFSMDWALANGATLDCTVLAVDLTNMGATSVEQGIVVDWTSHSEHNSSHFLLERSVNGTDFFHLARLEAQGNSATTTSYSFLDSAPMYGTNYYRLQQVDNSGSQVPTQVVSAQHAKVGLEPVLVPNPAGDLSTVVFQSGSDGLTRVELVDNRGQVVKEWTVSATKGTNRFGLSLAAVDAGSYLVRISTTGGVCTQTRLVKF